MTPVLIISWVYMELISGIRYTDKPFFFFLVQAIKEPLKKSAFEERNIYSIVFYRLIKGSYVWPKHYWHSPVFSYRSDSTANNKVPRTVSFDIYLSKQSSWNQEGSNSTGIFFFSSSRALIYCIILWVVWSAGSCFVKLLCLMNIV